MHIRTLLPTVLLSTIVCAAAVAQPGGRNKLKVGSQAPGITVDTWVKGEFKAAEAEVYVLEFWATWCAPCRKSIPHLTELQDEYGEDGLKVVGISTDSDAALVDPFVKRQGLKMSYIVGIDKRRQTQRAWMNAAGLKGIPAAFIVDRDGIIQYIGHPMSEEFEDVLSKVMSGRYDKKKKSMLQCIVALVTVGQKQ